MTSKPEITSKPKATSKGLIRFLLIKGSKKEVQSEVVAMPARQTEAVDTLADQKKKIQCKEISTPTPMILSKSRGATRRDSFRIPISTATPIAASNVR